MRMNIDPQGSNNTSHNDIPDNKDRILDAIENLEAKYIKEEIADLQSAIKYKNSSYLFALFAFVSASFGILYILIKTSHPDFLPLKRSNEITDYFVIGISTLSSLYLIYYSSTGKDKSDRLRVLQSNLLDYSISDLKGQIQEDFFTKLVDINFKYLDKYYLQTQTQASVSFKVARNAAIAGFAIICFGILMMFFEKTDQAYVTTAAGLISEAIAAIFYYLYNRTVLKMSQYHQKLVITQNISLALKTTESMDKESKDKALSLIIDRLTTDVNKHLSEK